MKTAYVIYQPQTFGYWSHSYKNFKGALYADYYNSIESAEKEIASIISSLDIKDNFITILKIYRNGSNI